MIVRPIEYNDKETFFRLVKEFYNSCATIRAYDEVITSKTFDYLMSKHENLWGYLMVDSDTAEPVGYALLTSYWCNEDGGNVVVLDEVYITTKNQHKGYGHQFLQWIEQEFRDKAVSITLEVLTSNNNAKQLYSKLGYSEDGFEVLTKKF